MNLSMVAPHERRVKDLWTDENRRWNKDRVHAIYGNFLGDQICNLPIGDKDHRDRVVWFHNPHGFYYSKSAYSWLMLKLGFRQDCPRCGAEKETLIHTLKDCPTARTILSIGGLDNKLLVKEYDCCIDWLEDVMHVLNKKATADFIIVLWNSWNNRNNFIFRGKEDNAQVVWERAKTLSHDFRIYNLMNDPIIPATPTCKIWEKPPRGYAKVNFDATINKNKTSYGFIIRDEEGFVIGGGGGFKEETSSAEWAKLYAFEESLKKARALNISKIVFETDNASLVNRVKKHGRDITIMGTRINEIQIVMGNFHSATI
ncbi:hypothetical protein Goshw_022500 [Gossypium schwendimanii]|uniref:RNase H type-1 domain-containing protein n=1 Tax=Gossypium schwendimanii TaxID=34291 RepID=A0A7J9N660_GOSSC|nr:hypothetical protein [Gossypium schwendimanii]